MILLAALSTVEGNEAQAQEKSRYEKIQERKNKANRRLKRRGDKSRKAKRQWWKFGQNKNRRGDQAHKGDITGRKVRSRISLTERSRAARPQPNPYAGRKRRTEASRAKAFNKAVRYSKKPRERAWKGDISGSKVRNKNFRTQKKRLSPRKNPRHGQRRGERDGARFSGQGFKGVRSISGRSAGSRKKRRIVPRSASGAFRVRKRAKPYAFRERSKWEDAYKGDITGRKFRAKGSSTQKILQKPSKIKYSFQGRGRRGDRAYKGQITGGYKSISSRKEKAWKNDISGTKLRIRTSERPKFNDPHFKPYFKRKRQGDKAYKGKLPGGGYKTAGRKIERAGKRALPSKPPGAGTQRGIRFQGNIKAGKPLKGGGSISGKTWNNNGRAIQGRGYKAQDQRIAKFQGNLKGGKPLKGGGSVKRNQWNNKGRPIQGRGFKDQDQRIAKFQGNLKGGRPKKGGGSLARNQWNNKERPIQGRGYRDQDQRIAKFQGNIRQWKYKTGPLDEMKHEGRFKRKGRFSQNPNASKDALKAKTPGKNDRLAARHTGNIKRWKYQTGPLDEMKFQGNIKRKGKYKRNPNTSKESLISKAPGKGTMKGYDFQGKFRRKGTYKRNPNAPKEALLSKAPETGARKGARFQGRFKMSASYKRNPNAAKESLKGIGPSKAAISASNYQGNLKMKKGRMGNRHPSYKFEQPKNTAIEKTKFSFKLLWSKLFKKSENQPGHLKEKERKPRYDKSEQGLWND